MDELLLEAIVVKECFDEYPLFKDLVIIVLLFCIIGLTITCMFLSNRYEQVKNYSENLRKERYGDRYQAAKDSVETLMEN